VGRKGKRWKHVGGWTVPEAVDAPGLHVEDITNAKIRKQYLKIREVPNDTLWGYWGNAC
jgi:hypothetical protein